MNKVFKILIMILVLGSGTLSACGESSSSGIDFTSHNLRGVEFSYPSAWENQTQDFVGAFAEGDPNWEQYLSAGAWSTPSEDSGMMFMVFESEYFTRGIEILTDDDKRNLAKIMGTALVMELLDEPRIQSGTEVEVDGNWAWEMGFSGSAGVSVSEDSSGDVLFIISPRTISLFLYFVDAGEAGELEGVYDDIKDSIKIQ
jgi:hypothetical protein